MSQACGSMPFSGGIGSACASRHEACASQSLQRHHLYPGIQPEDGTNHRNKTMLIDSNARSMTARDSRSQMRLHLRSLMRSIRGAWRQLSVNSLFELQSLEWSWPSSPRSAL